MSKTNHSIRLLWSILFIVCLHAMPAKAQDSTAFSPKALNTVYGEILGNGLAYSVNYDRLIDNSRSLRAGFSFIKIYEDNAFSLPISISQLINFGTSAHHIELGIGLTPYLFQDIPNNVFWVYIVPMAGYRIQPQEGGFNFRVLATPLFYLGSSLPIQPAYPIQLWGGLSIGYTF